MFINVVATERRKEVHIFAGKFHEKMSWEGEAKKAHILLIKVGGTHSMRRFFKHENVIFFEITTLQNNVVIIFHFEGFYYIYFAPTAAFDFIVAVQFINWPLSKSRLKCFSINRSS